jgi:CRP/FNR family transcriptional regulator
MEELKNKHDCKNCDTIVECFKNLTAKELESVYSHKVSLKYHKKEIVVKQGSFATNLIFVRSGYLKLYIESDFDNKDLIINIFGPNQLIGLSSLFESNVYMYSVATLVDAELCLFEVADIKKLIGVNADFALSILKRSHKSTLHAYQQMYNLTQKQLNGRVASAILYLSNHVFDSNHFEMILSRAELANFTAMSTMSAVRAINDLKKQDILTEENGVISIIDAKKLEQISKFG